MRTASLVLGITGCIFALLLGIFLVFMGAFFQIAMSNDNVRYEMRDAYNDMESYGEIYEASIGMTEFISNAGGYIFIGAGISSLISFVLSLTGSIFVKKKNVLAGVLLLIGAFFSLLSLWGFITAILLVLAGIFALIRNNSVPQNSGPENAIENT